MVLVEMQMSLTKYPEYSRNEMIGVAISADMILIYKSIGTLGLFWGGQPRSEITDIACLGLAHNIDCLFNPKDEVEAGYLLELKKDLPKNVSTKLNVMRN